MKRRTWLDRGWPWDVLYMLPRHPIGWVIIGCIVGQVVLAMLAIMGVVR